MGLSLERKTLLSCRSERVKAVDFHATEPWILSALYNGTVTIRNYLTNVLVKTIEVCELPVRTVKFVARKNWIIVGSDDLMIRVFNYNTLERVTQFTAHSDYIRGFIVHPTRPLILSCSDDMTIKAWDWEKAWKQVGVFEGHSNYVMGIALNPKDSNTFASASLDKTIKIWSLAAVFSSSSSSAGSSTVVSVKPNYTMGDGGHEKGINCIDFYGGSDRPFLVTGSDDQTLRIWDYQTKNCVRVLEGHTSNVSAVIFHPQIPFLLSAGEDSTLRIWNAQTFRPEASYNFGMDRAWGLACCRVHNSIGLAFDAGTVVFQLGRGDPCASLDPVQGRLVWSRARGSGSSGSRHGNEILTGMVRLLDIEGRQIRVPADAEIIPLAPKELGTSDVFPQNLLHSPDGRLVAVWGDKEYVIYSTIGWRNRAFGQGVEITWSSSGGDIFAVRDSNGRVSINRVSAHDNGIMVKGVSDCDRIYGGPLLGISTGGCTLSFYDWSGEYLIRTIDVVASAVSWSPDNSHVAILTDDSCYILAANSAVLLSPQSFTGSEDGIEDSLEVVDELEQGLKSVCWVSGNCFVYMTEGNRLAYHVVGGDADESFQLALFDRSHFLLGYLPGEERIYLTDQDLQVTSYAILPALITFQSRVLAGGDLTLSLPLLESIPHSYYARLAVFLQRRGYLREALKISPDPHFQFNLAIQLNDLKLARELLLTKIPTEQEKWQELGRVALGAWNLPIAEEALNRAGDLPSLFLLYAAAGDVDGLIYVAKEAASKVGQTNLAFAAYVKAGAYISAFELLLSENRAAEAALFARTYGLSAEKISKAVEAWRKLLIENKKEKIAECLADPLSHFDKFSSLNFVGDNSNVSSSAGNGTGNAINQYTRGRSVSFDGNVSVAGSNSTLSLKTGNNDNTNNVVFNDQGGYEEEFGIETESLGSAKVVTSGSITDGSTSFLSDDQMSLEVNTAGTGTRLEDLDEEIEIQPFEEENKEELGLMDDLGSIVEAEGRENENGSEEGQDCLSFLDEERSVRKKLEPVHLNFSEISGTETKPSPVSVAFDSESYVPKTSIIDAFTEPSVSESEVIVKQLDNLHVTETFINEIINVVESGGDVYDVVEAEFPCDDNKSKFTKEAENVMDMDSDSDIQNVAYIETEFTENGIESSAFKDAGGEFEYPVIVDGSEFEFQADFIAGKDHVHAENTEYPNTEEHVYAENIEYPNAEYSAYYNNSDYPNSEYQTTENEIYNGENENYVLNESNNLKDDEFKIKDKFSDTEEVDNNAIDTEKFKNLADVHEEIDFGGDGDADGWLGE